MPISRLIGLSLLTAILWSQDPAVNGDRISINLMKLDSSGVQNYLDSLVFSIEARSPKNITRGEYFMR